MKCDLILKKIERADGSTDNVVILQTPNGTECPITRVASNEKLLFRLKCEIKESD